ncbi:MAG: hypothetical protein IBJ18_12470 [Phycisphaerales bacterium]|nr:hypothetical protein [Phycisphaerales bacterium]
MKSLISDTMRDSFASGKGSSSKSGKHASHGSHAGSGVDLKNQTGKLIVLGAVVVVAGVVWWAPWSSSAPATPPAVAQQSQQLTNQIRELEEADKRMLPPNVQTTFAPPSGADANLPPPKSLRGKRP